MPSVRRLSVVATAGVLAVVTFGGWCGAPPASAAGPTIGPVQINALGHPGLCWQAGGNGSAVTLERCAAAVQGQQWSLTGDGVVMNGDGYCLEAGNGLPLYIDFASQCAGDAQGNRGQVWRYRAGQLASARTSVCADLGGPLWPGTEIVGGACRQGAPRWSIGYSAVTVEAGSGSGASGSGTGVPRSGAGAASGGTFNTSVTVANAASAQTAYGVAVRFALPPHLAATGLRVTGGGARWSCDVRALTCTGTLPSGVSGRIAIAGRLPAGARPGNSYTVLARASVAGTSQRRGPTRTTASLTVAVDATAPAAAAPAAAAPGTLGAPTSRSLLPLVAVVASALLLGGGLLILTTRRTRPPAGQSATPASRPAGRAGYRGIVVDNCTQNDPEAVRSCRPGP